MGSVATQPDYGRRLLVNLIDETARDSPDKVFAIVPREGGHLSEPATWVHVTFQQAAAAIDRMAHMIAGAVKGLSDGSGAPEPAGLPGRPADTDDATGDHLPTVSYIGPSDVRYEWFVLGASKARCKALLVSPRNTDEGQANLLARTKCRAVWAPASWRRSVESWMPFLPDGMEPLPCLEMDSLSALLTAVSEQKQIPFPFSKTFDDIRREPLVVQHTSGTTGLPKPILVRHGMWAQVDAFQRPGVPPTVWVKWGQKASVMVVTMPLFHSAGLVAVMAVCLYVGATPVFLPTDRPTSALLVQDVILHTPATGAVIAPSMVEEMSKTVRGMEALCSLGYILMGSGTISKELGDSIIKQGIHLDNVISCTEALPYALGSQPNPSDWDWFVFLDDLMGADFRPVPGEEDKRLYELFLVRRPNAPFPDMEMLQYTFPGMKEWSTRDLYIRHPTQPTWWRFYSRVDNIIVFSNGEKLNPDDIEQAISGQKGVRGALVVGSGRFQAGLIVELEKPPSGDVDAATVAAIMEWLWPHIEAVNRKTVAHGRISRDLVMLASAEKPFVRAGKGSVQRPTTTKLYAAEIVAMYERFNSGGGGVDGGDCADAADASQQQQHASFAFDIASEVSLANSFCRLLVDKVSVPAERLDDKGANTDFFFDAGMDSLQVIQAVRLLKSGLRATSTAMATATKMETNTEAEAADYDALAGGLQDAADLLDTRHFYANPTPARLAAFVLNTSRGAPVSDGEESAMAGDKAGTDSTELAAMQLLTDRYTTGFSRSTPTANAATSVGTPPSRPPPRRQNQTVLVTGTTGSLGSYILDELLHGSWPNGASVGRVVALNRDADGGRARQLAVARRKGLALADMTPTELEARVQFVRADLSQPRLGLDTAAYAALAADVDRIVHNAWPVHFHYGVETFEPSIAGTRHLADLAAAAAKRAPLLFVSSVSSVEGWGRAASATGPVPEHRLTDLHLPVMGYGRSKFVASLVVDAAAAHADVPAIVVRLGQVGGPLSTHSTAVWNPQELLPSVIASSVHLGVFPNSLGSLDAIDWLPSETAARAMLEMAGVDGEAEEEKAREQEDSSSSTYYHCVNPTTVAWADLLPAMQSYYGDRITGVLDLDAWIDRLAASGVGADAAALATNPAFKLVDQLRAFSRTTARTGPGFAMERSLARSAALRATRPISRKLMQQWCKQWNFEGRLQRE